MARTRRTYTDLWGGKEGEACCHRLQLPLRFNLDRAARRTRGLDTVGQDTRSAVDDEVVELRNEGFV